MLSAGAVSDRFGAAQAYLAGAVVFGVGSIVCATSPSFSTLVFGRVVQGVAAYLILPQLRRHGRARPVHRRRVDVAGQVCYVIVSASVIGGLILLGDRVGGLHRELAIGLLVLAGVGLVAFVLAERTAVDPVLPASVYTHRAFQSAVLVGSPSASSTSVWSSASASTTAGCTDSARCTPGCSSCR